MANAIVRVFDGYDNAQQAMRHRVHSLHAQLKLLFAIGCHAVPR